MKDEHKGHRLFRRLAWLPSLFFLILIVAGTTSLVVHPAHVDFLSFWAAGHLVISGNPSAAYDITAHRAVETTVTNLGLIPFPYPPPFLFITTPFALFPFSVAFALWIAVSIGAYGAGTRRLAPTREALAHPSVLTNGLIGQNGFFTTALFAGGLGLITRSPIVAGILLGLLSYKPQIALLVPVALIAGREWKVLGAAAASAFTFWLAALAAFGWDSYVGFLHLLPRYAEFLVESRWSWGELASPFAFVRYFGGSQLIAISAQVLAALVSAILVSILWWRKADGREAAVTAASLLVSPYVFTYDALLLSIALSWLLARDRFVEATIVWILCLLPVGASFGIYSGPNTVPVASILCLAAIGRINWATRVEARERVSETPQSPEHGGVHLQPATR